MITVPQASKKIIERSRYLTEAINKNLINLSSLARYIQPEIESITMKKVTEASILMSLKRIEKNTNPNIVHKILFPTPPTITVTSNLSLFIYESATVISSKALEKYTLQMTKGKTQVTILTETTHKKKIKEEIKKDIVRKEIDNLSSLSITLPKESITTSGIYYFFLKSLAWENINILTVFSTPSEFTILFKEEDIHTAFAIIKSLFV